MAQAHHAPCAQPSTLAGQPFTALPFVSATARRRHWAPPPASSYEQASQVGSDCGTALVAWLRANPSAEGQALLIWTLTEAFQPKTSIHAGYRAGFIATIARAIAGTR